ncbi:MAG TPA: FAD-binding oxidoreductase [Oleiagrimonas sp.]|nr:FAD-binding oxidoreductase [Oleiagrimonas sp.]
MTVVSTTASYYRATALPHEPCVPLEGRHDARIVIVGGGFAGLNTALSLAEKGIRDVTLLEAEDIGFGASGRNGGFVFAGYSLGEEALLERLGASRARSLFSHTVAAVETIRARIRQYDIDCNCVDHGVIWANWFRDPEVLRARQRLLSERFDATWEWLSREDMAGHLHTQRYSAGLFERNAMHIHPLKYARGLAAAAVEQGTHVHEHSKVTALARADNGGWIVRTRGGTVHAEHVVLACGGYLAGLDRHVDRAVLPIATYVMVTEPLGARLAETVNTHAAVYDTRFAFDYYRALPDTRLLWGGRISVRDRSAHAVKHLLRKDLLRVYPSLADVRIDYAWSGLMSYARHEMPQIGTDGHGLWWAQAFGGHGLAPTTAAGKLLAGALAGDDEDWREFAEFGLVRSFRPFGYLGAQARYSWLQMKDRLKEVLEG